MIEPSASTPFAIRVPSFSGEVVVFERVVVVLNVNVHEFFVRFSVVRLKNAANVFAILLLFLYVTENGVFVAGCSFVGRVYDPLSAFRVLMSSKPHLLNNFRAVKFQLDYRKVFVDFMVNDNLLVGVVPLSLSVRSPIISMQTPCTYPGFDKGGIRIILTLCCITILMSNEIIITSVTSISSMS